MGNGGVTDKYSWTQTLQDVNITVPVPAGMKGKDIVCDIGSTHLKFGLRGQTPLVDVRALLRSAVLWQLARSKLCAGCPVQKCQIRRVLLDFGDWYIWTHTGHLPPEEQRHGVVEEHCSGEWNVTCTRT